MCPSVLCSSLQFFNAPFVCLYIYSFSTGLPLVHTAPGSFLCGLWHRPWCALWQNRPPKSKQGQTTGSACRRHSTALNQLDRNGKADLYEAQSQAVCFMCSLDAVNNEQAAGSALQGTHIQQGFQQSPGGAHSSKQGWPHLSIRLACHTDHNVPEQREVADELRCSLKEWPCHQHGSLSCNNRLHAGCGGSKSVACSLANLAWCTGCNKPVVAALTADTPNLGSLLG